MSGAPVIPDALQIYNSYVVDPQWQRKFTIIWCAAVGAAIVVSLPALVRAMRRRRAFPGLLGLHDDSGYKPLPASAEWMQVPDVAAGTRRARGVVGTVRSSLCWTLPGTELDLGQVIVLIAYMVTVLSCITMHAPLVTNPNRAGFLALAQLPVVFLFGTKNTVVGLLIGKGYEKLVHVHKWAGRGVFIGSVVHGSLWIRNHIQYDLPILGQQKETSGVAALGVLCCMVLFSFRPVRRLSYNFFFITHVLGFVAFFVTLCYHTIYARPWIFPPLAFYALDLMMRLFRFRIKDATLVPVDQQMTIVNVHDCTSGWAAGQHVRLRVFIGRQLFESHPLTIMRAPPATSCLSASAYPCNGTLALGARATGDWSRALNDYARAERDRIPCEKLHTDDGEDIAGLGADVQVMIDGPYGGCGVDLGEYESVLLVAGGSGATFTLGLLDDIVGRVVRLGRRGGERTKRIEFAWCIKSFGAIEWFAQPLMEIATAAATPGAGLDLHVSVYVTCLCNPEAVPPIPNSDVRIERPSITQMLRVFTAAPGCAPGKGKGACCCDPKPSAAADRDMEAEKKGGDVDSIEIEELPAARDTCACAADPETAGLAWTGLGGGVAVCASGPERLTREAKNAVALLGTTKSMELGGVALHTELFAL